MIGAKAARGITAFLYAYAIRRSASAVQSIRLAYGWRVLFLTNSWRMCLWGRDVRWAPCRKNVGTNGIVGNAQRNNRCSKQLYI